MEALSKTEELILLAVWKLQENAYGITIRKHLKDTAGQDISIGGIYVPLDRLVRKGYLQAVQGKPTSERGGMSKRFYKLTEEGCSVLSKSKKVLDTMWDDLPDIKFSEGK